MSGLQRRPHLTDSLIEHFAQANDLEEIERLADDLGNAHDPAAIDILLYRLGDGKIQSDADTEDAVCAALVQLGVMTKRGNLNYRILADEALPPEAKTALSRYGQLIPQKYYSSREDSEQ
jgi:hypothetical protein